MRTKARDVTGSTIPRNVKVLETGEEMAENSKMSVRWGKEGLNLREKKVRGSMGPKEHRASGG